MPLDLTSIADAKEDLVIHRVDIEELKDPSRDSSGGPSHTYKADPIVSDVPCLIIPRETTLANRQFIRQGTRLHRVFFWQPIELGPRRRIRDEDPILGTRYLYSEHARNVAEASALWIADAEEYS